MRFFTCLWKCLGATVQLVVVMGGVRCHGDLAPQAPHPRRKPDKAEVLGGSAWWPQSGLCPELVLGLSLQTPGGQYGPLTGLLRLPVQSCSCFLTVAELCCTA